MPEDFDPYRKWLGIPPDEQPPNHYRLLGIPLFEHDPDVIDNAANRQMAHVRTFQTGKHSRLSQQVLNELSAAKVCLLVPDKKQAYDEELRAVIEQESSASPPAAAPAAPPPPRNATAQPPTTVVPVRAAAAVAVEPKPASVSNIPVVGPRRSSGRVSSAASRARARRKSSMMPILLGVIGVAVLIGLLVVAVNIANNQPSGTANPAPVNPGPPTPAPVPMPQGDTHKSPGIRPSSGGKTHPSVGTTGTPSNLPETGGQFPPPAQPSPAGQFQQAVRLARQALSRRDLDSAKTQLVEAELAQSSPEQRAEVERLRAMRLYINEFWDGVRDGINKAELNTEFEFQGEKFELTKREGELVAYKNQGAFKESLIRGLPAAHAIAFARQAMSEDDAFTYIYVGAFVAFDDQGDPVKRIEDAKQFWQQAVKMGHTNKYLAQELGLDDSGSGSTIPGLDDPSPVPPLKPATPAVPPSQPIAQPPLQPAQPQRTPVPDPRAQARARAALRSTYAKELQGARTSDTRIALSDMLTSKAAGEQDIDLQFVTWEEARDLAVAAGKPQSLLDIVDRIAETFDVDALSEKQTHLAKFNAEPDADSSEVLKLAEDLCKLAEQQQRYDLAAGFADTASRAARKANNFTAVQTYTDEIKRLKALAAEKQKTP